MEQWATMQFTPIASGYSFVEAPRVDDDGTLYFSDLLGGGFYRRRAGGTDIDTLIPGRMWVGGTVLDESGAVLCSGRGGIVRIDPDRGTVTPLLTELESRPVVAINDIEADAHGGIFGGSVDFAALFERGEIPSNGQFFHLPPEGPARVLREGLVVSNGLGFSPDGRWLYHSETMRGIWIYPLAADGTPGKPELFAGLEDSDGLVVDSEGCVWLACWKSARILRFRPDGNVDRTITLPFTHIVSLAFGGPDLTDLYVATGTDDAHPGQGGVVCIKSDVPGLRPFRSRMAATVRAGAP
ncbi:MAG TPA: SMP-30/gluconolactonase/LRE family protein [Steroidobacteraceae bacterium]|nr:SMP-30/gluconolactonase/LRE family protein [Steroidobacteraceae bacterium]